MDDPIFNSNNVVGGSSANYTFSAMSREIHSNQSFILIQTFTEADGGLPFDISGSTSTLLVSAYKNASLDAVPLTSGVLSDSGGGTIDTVTFTVPKDLIPVNLGSFPQRNGGNSRFFYILEDADSILEFAQGVNVIDPSYGLTGDVDPGASTITTQRNDLGTVEDTVIVIPPVQSFGLAYVVGPAGATGDWVGQENNLAVSNGSSWIFTLPEEGNFVFDKNISAQKAFNGATWEVSAGGDMLSGVYDPQTIVGDAFARANMTGTQDHTTISDYDTELAGTSNVTVFTPTADYQPATKKYVDDATPAVSFNDLSDVTLTTVAQGDILYYNGIAWVNLGPGVNGQFFKTQGAGANPAWESIAGGGDMLASTYDPANIAEQLVGLSATQSLTNKTVNGVVLTATGSSLDFLNAAGNYVTVSGGGGFPSGRISPTVTATTDIDWSLGDTFTLGTLLLDVTLTFSGLVQGQTIAIEYTGDSGFDVIALPGTVVVLNGGASTADSFNVIYVTATNAATDQQAAYSTDSAAAAGALSVAIYEDQKATTVAGGSSVAGTQTRTINTEVSDIDNLGTLSANAVTLISGVYLAEVTAPAFGCNGHQAFLNDGTSNILIGSSAFTGSGDQVTTNSIISDIIIADGIKAYSVNHFTALVSAINGLGVNASSGAIEVYTRLKFTKIG